MGMVLPFLSDRRISASCLIVLMACWILMPCIDPDVSRRNPAMSWRGAVAAAVAVAICGAMISSFPNIRLLFVRLLINGMMLGGISPFAIMLSSTVVSLVENILIV